MSHENVAVSINVAVNRQLQQIALVRQHIAAGIQALRRLFEHLEQHQTHLQKLLQHILAHHALSTEAIGTDIIIEMLQRRLIVRQHMIIKQKIIPEGLRIFLGIRLFFSKPAHQNTAVQKGRTLHVALILLRPEKGLQGAEQILQTLTNIQKGLVRQVRRCILVVALIFGQEIALLVEHLHLAGVQQPCLSLRRRTITSNNSFFLKENIHLGHRVQKSTDILWGGQKIGDIATAPAYAVDKILARHIAKKMFRIA